jgi:hypothetical protein
MKLTEDDLEALRARIDRGYMDGHGPRSPCPRYRCALESPVGE